MNQNKKSFLEEISHAVLFQKVSDICALVNNAKGEQELLDASLSKTLELFGANRGSIFIKKQDSEELVLRASVGMAHKDEARMTKRMGSGIVGKVAQTMHPIYVNDIASDERFEDFKARGSYATPSFICVPLLVKDELIGVINITDKKCGSSFVEEEMRLLDFLSSQIALNIRRVQLYSDFRNVVNEAKDLKDKLGQRSQEARDLKKKISLQEKLATIGKLAGGIAHEFNNPLDGVIRYTNLCLEHIKDDEVVRGYLLEIKQGLNRMTNIVKDLLICSRNDLPLEDKVDFLTALDRSLGSVKAELSAKNIKVRKEIEEGLPSFYDLGLERILTNLFRNSIDAMSENGQLTIKAVHEEDMLFFEISDDGSGIDSDKLDHVFEPFFTTKDIDKGSGLGLTIVGEIIKNYNGKIDVASAPQKGTVFSVRLPWER